MIFYLELEFVNFSLESSGSFYTSGCVSSKRFSSIPPPSCLVHLGFQRSGIKVPVDREKKHEWAHTAPEHYLYVSQESALAHTGIVTGGTNHRVAWLTLLGPYQCYWPE